MKLYQEPPINIDSRRTLAHVFRKSIPSGFVHLLLYFWIAFTVFVLLWIILASFKTNREIFDNVWSLPHGINIESYKKAWTISKMGNYFLNSVLVVTISTVGTILLGAPASYVLARIQFRSREFITNFFLIGMGIPRVLLLVPLFMLLRRLLLLDSLIGLGITYTAISLPFTVFMLTAFFSSLPGELEEAAAIDGASPFSIYWRVMFPLAKTGIITVFIFNFIWNWKDYFWALVLISTESKKTVSLGLYGLQGSMQYSADWSGLLAGSVIVMVPTLIIYIIMSKRIISGMTLGAVKG
jgi:raffinose/stachyose/melibiose transport system permease protein/N-acetylglucosamine transport system permease protein